MKKSKLIFAAVAAVAALVIVLLIVFAPEGGNTDPSSGQLGSQPSELRPYPSVTPEGSTVYIDPFGPDNPLQPTEDPEDSDIFGDDKNNPSDKFTPDDEETPESTQMHYVNEAPITISIPWFNYTYEVSFGISKTGNSNYLYLSPEVQCQDKSQPFDRYFQFYFEPSVGYVTTISNSPADHYKSNNCHSTFERALDYGLPSCYVSDEEPGTVWYINEDPTSEAGFIGDIDVAVFINGRFFAYIRIMIERTDDGNYKLGVAENLNLLQPSNTDLNIAPRLPVAQLDAMIAQMVSDLREWLDYFGMEEHEVDTLKREDFIIARHEVGSGTLFEYYTDANKKLVHRSTLQEEEIYSVSVGLAALYGNRVPAIMYYRVIKGGGDNGEDVYELVGIEYRQYFYKHSLYYSSYPGWCQEDLT